MDTRGLQGENPHPAEGDTIPVSHRFILKTFPST